MALKHPVSAAMRASLVAQRDERLGLYVAVAAAATALGVLGGGLRLIVIGVPFGVAAIIGTRRRDAIPIAVEVSLRADRCVEGDRIEGRIDVNVPHGTAVELAIERRSDLFGPDQGEVWAWSVPDDVERPLGIAFAVRAERWGRGSPGQLRVRLVDHGSLLQRHADLLDLPPVTVWPAAPRIERPGRLARPFASVGAHPTRVAGAGGYDFAEVREYRPGDRLRDLNWTATLRRDEPAVNHRLPERSGEIVLVVDSFPDALRRHSELSRVAILTAGRIAWALAEAHLTVNDRVAVLAEGARPVWLAPQSGRRARHAIFAALLHASTASLDAAPERFARSIAAIPPNANIVALTPLARPSMIERLTSLRAKGHVVDVIALDIDAALTAAATRLPDEVARIRRLLFEEQVAALRRHGIRVVSCAVGSDGGDALRAIIRRPSRIAARR